jgi:benzoylformate decarboxylase
MTGTSPDPIAPRRVVARNPGDPLLLDEIAGVLARANAPAFVLGAGIARDGAWQEAIALAERHSAKVWAAPFAAREVFPERHPLFAGFLNPGREAIVHDLRARSYPGRGRPLSLYHTEGFGPHLPEGAQLYHIVDSIAVASWAPDGAAVIADAKSALARLQEARRRRHARGRPAAKFPRRSRPPADRCLPAPADRRLRPAGSVIVEEAPSSRGAMHDHLPIQDAGGFFTCASGGLARIARLGRCRAGAARCQGDRHSGRWIEHVRHSGPLVGRAAGPARQLRDREQPAL